MSANDVFLLKIKKKIFFEKKVGKSGELWRKSITFVANSFLKEVHMRFVGTIEAKTDAKGRAFLPATFRKELQAAGKLTMMLRKDIFEPCLVLYPESVWNERVDTLSRRLSIWNRAHQRIMRQFMSDVEEVSLDANGRFLIPKRYLEMAGINTDIKFIGTGATIEIWSGENTQEPFLSPDEFGQALEDVMGQENPLSANTLENIIR